jgi:hypothetical protein
MTSHLCADCGHFGISDLYYGENKNEKNKEKKVLCHQQVVIFPHVILIKIAASYYRLIFMTNFNERLE